MPNQSDARKRILTFLGLAFSLSVIFWVLIIRAGSIRAGRRNSHTWIDVVSGRGCADHSVD